jgi:uncharacterized protein
MSQSAHARRTSRILGIVFLLTIFLSPSRAQQSPAQKSPARDSSQQQSPEQSGVQSAQPEKSKIRSITFFLNIDHADYREQIADAYKSLRFAQTIFESRGYVVQNIRIATQPFSEYTRDLSAAQALVFFQDLDAIAAKDKLQICIGPAMYHSRDGTASAELLSTILLNTKSLSGSIIVADKDGLHANAAVAAARIIKKLSEGTPRSQGALRFAALAMVPPLTPDSPSAYVDGFGHQFSISLQSANIVAAAVNGAPDAEAAKHRVADAIGANAYDVDAFAGRVDGETGWAYIGTDLSPEPSKDDSIGAAIEILSGHQAGSPEAVAAGGTISSAIRGIGLKQIGLSALPLPILEDRRLAQRWSEGRIGIDTLLDYFSAGSTGLAAVPLPGDVSGSQLELIIVNAATAAYRARKAMILTLVPVAGKAVGERTEFDDPRLVNVTLQPLNYPRAKP